MIRPIVLLAAALVLLAASGEHAVGQGTVARLELVSGDRQILKPSSQPPPQSYVVRAVDSTGKPVAGVGVLMLEATQYSPGIAFRDEFGFFGFGQLGITTSGFGLPPGYDAITDVTGIATTNGRLPFVAPAAFLVAASHYGPGNDFPPAFFSVVKVSAPPPGNPTVVVEFFENDLGHYFNTALQTEIDALEANVFPGWHRSVGSFVAYATAQDAPPGAVPVCRFFSSTYTAHFYTADPGECDAVIVKWPNVWTLETRTAFYIQVPDKATGACGSGLQPVYRLYSTRNGPNHRYVADSNLRDAMVRSGWTAEGYGPDNVMLCTAK